MLSSFQKAFNETIYQVEPFITWQNFFAFIKVGFALIITIIFGSLSSIKFLGEFTLKLIRELSVLIQAISPIVIHIIDFCSKVVGGFFILLAGVFRAFSPTHVYMDSSGSNTYANIGNSNMNSNPPLNWRERNRILRQEFLKISYKKS